MTYEEKKALAEEIKGILKEPLPSQMARQFLNVISGLVEDDAHLMRICAASDRLVYSLVTLALARERRLDLDDLFLTPEELARDRQEAADRITGYAEESGLTQDVIAKLREAYGNI